MSLPASPANSPLSGPVPKLMVSLGSSSAVAPVSKPGTKIAAAWQELTRDRDGKMKLMEVRNFGVQKTSRRFKRRKEQELSKNKPQTQQEVEKKRKGDNNKLVYEEKMKTTSPIRVKLGSNHKNRKTLRNSPSLKRLKPLNLAKMLPRTNPIQNELKNSPFNFKKLLSSWEVLSAKTLTPVVNLLPKSAKFADSQSGRCLENVRVEKKLKMLGQPSEFLLDAKIEARPKSGSSANEMGLEKI